MLAISQIPLHWISSAPIGPCFVYFASAKFFIKMLAPACGILDITRFINTNFTTSCITSAKWITRTFNHRINPNGLIHYTHAKYVKLIAEASTAPPQLWNVTLNVLVLLAHAAATNTPAGNVVPGVTTTL